MSHSPEATQTKAGELGTNPDLLHFPPFCLSWEQGSHRESRRKSREGTG